MKTKKLLIILIAAVLGITMAFSSALAGNKQRHRWEGVAIGVGAAILGHAIYQAHKVESQPQGVYVQNRTAFHRHGHQRRHGHWEWQKTWVPPCYDKVWNPGHYNRRGHWVPGHWITIQTAEGYWTRERVWVARNHGWR